MRVVVLSTVFPNPKQPTFGVFVRERMRRVATRCELEVVAPIPWFPFNGVIRGAQATGLPRVEQQGTLRVHHPRVFCVPRYGKWLDGLFYAMSLVPFMARLRARFPFDVIDSHFAYPDGLAAVLLGRWFRRPAVITLRGSIVRLATYRLHRPQLRFALTHAARIFSVSQSLKDVAIGLGIPAPRIRVIANGVDTERFFPRDRAQCRQALGLPPDRTIILSVGGLNEGKGHHRIVALLPALLARHPDLLYVIVGGERAGDSARATIERTMASHGIGERVRLAGERPHEEIPLWLGAADLFCLATRSEGWANVLLEALACGRAVVATRVGGNAEIVSSDDLGLLVPPSDDAALAEAILAGLQRPWDTGRLVAHARAHSWEAAAATVLDELTRLVRVGEPGTPALATSHGRERGT